MVKRTFIIAIVLLFMVGMLPPVLGDSKKSNIPPGVIVFDIDPASAVSKAGIQTGDILIAADNLPLYYPDTITLILKKTAENHKANVTLHIYRDGKIKPIDIPADGDTLFVLRPPLPSDYEKKFQECLQTSSITGTASKICALAGQLEKDGELRPAVCLWDLAYKLYFSSSEYTNAANAAQHKTSVSKLLDDPYGIACGLLTQAICADTTNKPDDAEACYKQALPIIKELLPDSHDLSTIYINLGRINRDNGFLTEAKSYYTEALDIELKLNPESLDNASIINIIGLLDQDLGNLNSALDHYKQALAFQEKYAPDSVDISYSLNNVGHVLVTQGHPKEAIVYFKKALAIHDKLGTNTPPHVTVLNNMGLAVNALGDIAGAKSYYMQALDLQKKLDINNEQMAYIYNNLGTIALDEGDFTAAKSYFQQALSIAIHAHPNSLIAATCYNNLGSAANASGDMTGAINNFNKALAIQEEKVPGTLAIAATYHNIGNTMLDAGDLTSAEEHFKKALAIQQKTSPDSKDIAITMNNLGKISQLRGNYAEAIHYYQSSLKIQVSETQGSLDEALILNNIGNVFQNEGDIKNAELYYNNALAIYKAKVPNSMDAAIVYNNLGSIAVSRNDLKQAESYYDTAYKIRKEKAPRSIDMAISLCNLGQLAFLRHNIPNAKNYYRRATDLIQEIAPKSYIYADMLIDQACIDYMEKNNTGVIEKCLISIDLARKQQWPDILWKSLYQLGLAQFISGDKVKSLASLKEAVDVFESIHYTDKEAREKIIKTSGPANLYNDLIEFLIGLGKPDDALQYLERSKSKAVLDILNLRNIETKDARLTDLLVRYGEIQTEIIVRQRDLIEENSKPADKRSAVKIDQLTKLLAKTKSEFYQTVNDIRKTYGVEYASLVQVEPAEFSQVQKALPANTVIVEYFPASDKLYCFLITHDHFEVVEHAVKRDDLDTWVTEVRDAMKTWQSGMGEKETPPALFHLYDHLITPIEQKISSYKTVIVAPSGTLWYLPFSALASRDGSKNIHYLVERDQQFINLTQIGLLGKLLENNKAGSEKRTVDLAAFGNPSGIKPALPQSEAEVGEIAHYYKKANVFTGKDASKAKVSEEAQRCRILHFATHGSLRHDDPNQSCLTMAVSTTDDGLLTQGEIFGLPLDGSRLVVLSACETALAEENPGRELSSLSQAFTIAGAPSVIASLWSVNDASTSRLMSVFYRELASGKSKSQALQTSQRELLHDKKYSHPYFWAAFELFGAWE